jgi:hypothetical protein
MKTIESIQRRLTVAGALAEYFAAEARDAQAAGDTELYETCDRAARFHAARRDLLIEVLEAESLPVSLDAQIVHLLGLLSEFRRLGTIPSQEWWTEFEALYEEIAGKEPT